MQPQPQPWHPSPSPSPSPSLSPSPSPSPGPCQAVAAATADRQEFVAALEAGAKATDELCESAEAEEALRHLRAKGSREASLSLDSEGAPA